MSLRKLAERAGISNPYLSQIERGLRNPSGEILKAIAWALYLPAEALYERAGLLEQQERPGVETAIRNADDLTNGPKQPLMEIYRSFVGNTKEEA